MGHCQEELGEIRGFLNANPRGLSIQEIAGMLGVNRNSVSKYLEILQMQGFVDLRRFGNAKMYIPASRYQTETLQRLCTDGLLLLNKELTIVNCNSRISDHLGSRLDALLGKPLENLASQFTGGDQILTLATAAVRGREGTISIPSRWDSLGHDFQLNLLPTVFSNGHPGAAVLITGGSCEGNSDRELHAGNTDLGSILLDQMEEVYCRLSLAHTIIEVNETFSRLSGHCREGLIGFRFKLMVPDEDWECVSSALLSLNPQGPPVTIEHRILSAEGAVKWVRWKYRGLYSWDGGLMDYLCTGLEITDLKRTKERLEHFHTHFEEIIRTRTDELREINRQLYQEVSQREATEQQLRLAQFGMDQSTEIIVWTDKIGMITQANRQGMNLLGCVIGEPLMGCIGGTDQEDTQNKWQKLWNRLVRNGSLRMEQIIRSMNGSSLPVEMVIDHISFGGKEYASFSIRDISERKGHEVTLWRAKEKYRLLIENARDIIFKISFVPEVCIDYISPSIELLTGYTPKQFYDRPALICQLLNERDLRAFFSCIKDPARISNLVTVKVRRHDSSWGRLEISVVFTRDDLGCITVVEGIGRDITTRKEAEMAQV